MTVDRKIRASLLSISTDLVLIGIKGGLALLTGSLALAADAFHSLSDLVVSISVLAGILLRKLQWQRLLARGNNSAAQPPDGTSAALLPEAENHGHWIESSIAAIVSLLILYMPVEIIAEVRAKESEALDYAWAGILGTLVCIAIIYFVSRFKIIVGRDTNSPALEADGYHSRVDMFTSVAVLFSLMGQIIGIGLDPIVAVIIAVLIGITGADLFVSSMISLVKGSDLQQLSIWESLFEWFDRGLGVLSHTLLGRRFSLGQGFKLRSLFRPKMVASAILIITAVYAATGVTILKPWEYGVRLRFGEVIDQRLEAGLHYHLPFPFETIARVNMAQVQRVELGFRTDLTVARKASTLLWEAQHGKAGYRKLEQESLMLTGDESIVDLSLVVHYRPHDAVTHWLNVKDIDEIVRGLSEATARGVLATEPSDVVLSEARTEVMQEIRRRLAEQAERLNLGIEILAVYAHDLHPPLDVVPAFRDVFSAKEDKARLLSEAQAYRNEALPRANGQRTQRLAEAESFAVESRLHAEGDAQKFEQFAEAYALAPALTRYRLFLETVEAGLADREKIIADPSVNQGAYQLWLFAPDQQPNLQVKRQRSRGVR